MRGTSSEITSNAKKTSKREQDTAKKTRHVRKKRLRALFGEGPWV